MSCQVATHPIKEAEIRINAVLFSIEEKLGGRAELIEDELTELEDIQEMLNDAMERSGFSETGEPPKAA